ncbi:MAG: universal stress protein [Acidimicrobiia bacterium]
MFRTIVVGTDGSKTAYRAVRKASELTRLCPILQHAHCTVIVFPTTTVG